jgi:protease-4
MGLLGFFIVSFLFVIYVIAHAFGNPSSNLLSASDEITLIEIQGPIFQSDDVVRRIKRFRKSGKKVLLLRLNSPGGAVAPSQEIYSEILKAREEKKIVVASMANLAASGAYYIAAAADKIIANPGTVTGSIGVIAEFPDASGLLSKVGVRFQTIKSGKFKDTGNFGRPMTGQEKAYLQETIDDVFQQFLESVLTSRLVPLREKLAVRLGLKPSEVTVNQVRDYILQYADGRVLTGKKAYELGFIDKLGNYYDGVRLAADLAGIKGEPSIRLDQGVKLEQFFNNLLPFSLLSRPSNGFELNYRAF